MRAKAIPNNFLDYHPKFVKNGGRWVVFILYFSYFFLTALKTEHCLKKHLIPIDIKVWT